VSPVLAAAAANIDVVVFTVCAIIVLAGALGVIFSRNPVYCALSLVLTLFGVAVLFVEQDAQFLAAVQVIVYAGAIVVLFLFVIMLLGVDKMESVGRRLPGQRPMALLVGLATLGELLALARWRHWVSGASSAATTPAQGGSGNTSALARSLFTTYLLPFELTSLLLIIAVLAAVVLARRPAHSQPGPQPMRESPDPGLPLAPAPEPGELGISAHGIRDVSDEEVGAV